MAHFSEENLARAEPARRALSRARSALIPLCHLAQAQDGYLTEEAMEDIAELVGVTPAEVRGTASFYDMLHTEPVGRYVVAVCTNIACMLARRLRAARARRGAPRRRASARRPTTGMFTIEEAECLAACDVAPCVQVNHRFFGPLDARGFDRLVDDLRSRCARRRRCPPTACSAGWSDRRPDGARRARVAGRGGGAAR